MIESIMLHERNHSQRSNTTEFHLYETFRIEKYVDTESSLVLPAARNVKKLSTAWAGFRVERVGNRSALKLDRVIIVYVLSILKHTKWQIDGFKV